MDKTKVILLLLILKRLHIVTVETDLNQIQQSEMKQKESERRRYPRHNVVLDVQGICTDEESNNPVEFQGGTRDASLCGLSLLAKTGRDIHIGQQFKILIQLFQGEDPIEATGQVHWIKEVDEEQDTEFVLAGFELLAMNPRKYSFWSERIHWNA